MRGGFGPLFCYNKSMLVRRTHRYGIPWITIILTLGLIAFSTLGPEWFTAMFVLLMGGATS